MQQNIGERLRRSGSSRCDEWLSGQRRAPLGLGGIMGTVTQAVGLGYRIASRWDAGITPEFDLHVRLIRTFDSRRRLRCE